MPLDGGSLFVALCRFYWGVRRAPARSSGGSGVIFVLVVPPGSHRPRVAWSDQAF